MNGEEGVVDLLRGDPDRPGPVWWLFGLALVVVLVHALRSYLGWFVFGLFLYYVARPIARRLRRRGVPPGPAAALTMTIIVLPFVALLGAVAAVTLGQLSTVRVADVEGALRILFPNLDVERLPTSPERLYRSVGNLLDDPTVRSLVEWGRGVVGTFAVQTFNAFLALVFTFFLVRDDRRLAGWFRSNVVGEESAVTEYLRAVDRGLTSVYFGYTLTIVVIVVLSAIIYTVLNAVAPPGMAIPQTMLVAVATGFATVVPLVGRSIVYAVVVAYLGFIAVRTDPARLWFPVLFYVVMGLVFDNVVRTYIRPSLSGRLYHTGLIMFAYLLGPPVFGWYGIFLGPLLMVLAVQYARLLVPRMFRGRPESAEEAEPDEPAVRPDGTVESPRSESDDG